MDTQQLNTFSNLQWMEMHINTLYKLNDQGRMSAVNELGDPTAPRFYMGRTNEGNRWLFRHDLPTEVAAELDALCRSEPIATDLQRLPENYQAIHQILAQHTPIADEHHANEYRGPAYWAPPVALPAVGSAGAAALLLNDENAHFLQPHYSWLLQPELYQLAWPVAMSVEEGAAVSVCFCSRTPQEAAEAGLYTHEGFRRRGHALAVVTGWVNAMHQWGCIPLYGTSWENLASQGVARKLGMKQYGEDWSID